MFAANAVQLQLHAVAYNSHQRTRALPRTVEQWSRTSPREKVMKIGAKVIAHAR